MSNIILKNLPTILSGNQNCQEDFWDPGQGLETRPPHVSYLLWIHDYKFQCRDYVRRSGYKMFWKRSLTISSGSLKQGVWECSPPKVSYIGRLLC